ncbi:MAG: Fe-S cluster assembly protein SufD [Dehalococcoidia bacterium]
MTTQTERLTISRAAVEALSQRFGEPAWLLKRRLDAWRLFEEAPMPDPLSEEWKKTDATLLTLEGLAPFAPKRDAIDSAAGLPRELRGVWDENEELAGRLVQYDSDVVYCQLDETLAKQGVVLTDLHSAARDYEHVLRDRFESLVSPGEWKYPALHSALWSGGCLIYVPDGVEVQLPIEYAAVMAAARTAVFPHLLIVAGANSSVTVVQESTSPDGEGLSLASGAVEIFAGEGAQVRFIDVQRWGHNAQNFVTMRAQLGRSASFQAILLGLGGALTKSRLDVVMDNEGAHAALLGLFVGDGGQHFDYDTRQDHIAPRTESDLLFKAALTDSASLAWNGVVDVRETASQAAANQTSRNLLLSDKASASPTPILEISAYDVQRCSHGATVGPVDREQIFYLQSRGIPHDEAERMLVEGFFSEVLERVPSERLQQRVRRVLESKIALGD